MPRRSIPPVRGPLKMRDVARIAEVSTATVSRVLNNPEQVDPSTAARVRAVIQQTNYVPNNTGTALKSGRSGIFGLIVPDLSNPFFADFVKHFERQVVNRDQEMLLAISDHSPEQMQGSIRRMLMRGVEGLVILESEIKTGSYETILHNRLPLVTLNRLLLEPGVSDVAVDATSGMLAAAAHLKALGHRHIGFLGGHAGGNIALARETSFRRAMKANRLRLDEAAMVCANFTVDGGGLGMSHLLGILPAVTAVICANDLSAIGAMQTLADRSLEPGHDVSVVGLDDIDLCTIVRPQLTTLRLPRHRLVRLFLEALTALHRHPHRPGTQYFQEVELVLRGTTGPPPRATTKRGKRRGTS